MSISVGMGSCFEVLLDNEAGLFVLGIVRTAFTFERSGSFRDMIIFGNDQQSTFQLPVTNYQT